MNVTGVASRNTDYINDTHLYLGSEGLVAANGICISHPWGA